jgi:alkylhydroperoxidase family enzyme
LHGFDPGLLTSQASAPTFPDCSLLRDADVDDGQILEAKQIIGSFNYVNRCLNGLGVSTDNDVVGYYASKNASKDD